MKTYVVETDAIRYNLDALTSKAGKTPIWAVLKGNGYGLGVAPMAELAWQAGIRRFAVTEPGEARTIRERFPDASILMLRPTTDPGEMAQLLELDAIATIGSTEDAAALNSLAAQRDVVAQVHVKVDTGMGRYGFLPEEKEKILSVYRYNDHIAVTGIYTHFHTAFGKAKHTFAQAEQFRGVITAITDAGIEPGEAHCCNSAAFLRFPELWMDGVRLGSALLGRVLVKGQRLRRVGYCEATVDELRWLPAGHTTGYGAAWKAKKPTRIAVIGVGWYHGFTNEYGRDIFRFRDCLRDALGAVKRMIFKKKIYVTVGGKKCPVLGHVGMLHTVVDVTKVSVQPGDKAILEISPLQVRGMELQFREK